MATVNQVEAKRLALEILDLAIDIDIENRLRPFRGKATLADAIVAVAQAYSLLRK